MTQKMLNGLAMLVIKNKFLDDVKIEEVIENFVLNNVTPILRFKVIDDIITFLVIL
ncbi:hypothetical protein LINGRAHAP2_LOCUS15955 [Linum grandiflorum]